MCSSSKCENPVGWSLGGGESWHWGDAMIKGGRFWGITTTRTSGVESDRRWVAGCRQRGILTGSALRRSQLWGLVSALWRWQQWGPVSALRILLQWGLVSALRIVPQWGPWVLSGYYRNEGHGCPPDIAAMRAMGALWIWQQWGPWVPSVKVLQWGPAVGQSVWLSE